MALVLLVMSFSILSGSIPSVCSSMSQKIGMAFCIKIDDAVEIHEYGVTITSSPSPMSNAAKHKCRP